MHQVITLSITGALNAVLSEEHKKEMCRYLYNHQAIKIPFITVLVSLTSLFKTLARVLLLCHSCILAIKF